MSANHDYPEIVMCLPPGVRSRFNIHFSTDGDPGDCVSRDDAERLRDEIALLTRERNEWESNAELAEDRAQAAEQKLAEIVRMCNGFLSHIQQGIYAPHRPAMDLRAIRVQAGGSA